MGGGTMRDTRALSIPVLLTVGCGGVGGGGGGASKAGGAAGAAPSAAWQSRDVGAVGQAGATSLNGSVFQVSASGGDIWDAADAFRFVYKPLSGDGEITARVLSLAPTDAWAKAGVMIRESLAADSAFAMTVVTPSNGRGFQYRAATGAGAALVPGAVGAAPTWLRVTRAGNAFSGACSADGLIWTPLGSLTIPMATAASIRQGVPAHTNGLL